MTGQPDLGTGGTIVKWLVTGVVFCLLLLLGVGVVVAGFLPAILAKFLFGEYALPFGGVYALIAVNLLWMVLVIWPSLAYFDYRGDDS